MGNIFDQLGALLSKQVLESYDEVTDTTAVLESAGGSGRKAKEKELNGFYDKEGNYLGTDNVADDKVYVTTKYNIEYMTDKDGMVDWKNVIAESEKLEMSHADFMYCAGVISQEGSGDTLNEMSGIGHVIKNNSSGIANMVSAAKRISTVPYKQRLLSSNDTQKANYARAGLIHALLEDDITDGAIFWDGEDFLAWGIHRPARAGGGAHPKLKYGVEISKDIYDNYLNAVLAAHPSGKISYQKAYGVTCDVPDEVFTDPNNWYDNNTVFRYKTDGGSPTIKASYTSGRTIFWKKI